MPEPTADEVLQHLRPLAIYLRKAISQFQAAQEAIPDIMAELVTDEDKLAIASVKQRLAAVIDERRDNVSTVAE